VIAIAIYPQVSAAQVRTTPMTLPGAVARGSVVSFNGGFHHRPFSPGAVFLGTPFYADYVEPYSASPVPPQVVVLQPTNPSEAPPEAATEPLLIELQGDRYVRFGGRKQSADRGVNAPPEYAEAEAHSSEQTSQRPNRPEIPAILIFRDGHREPVAEYAIISGTLYTNDDYAHTGRWTRNIQLSSLDLPATMQANRNAGVRFTLPSAPNEIVTRP